MVRNGTYRRPSTGIASDSRHVSFNLPSVSVSTISPFGSWITYATPGSRPPLTVIARTAMSVASATKSGQSASWESMSGIANAGAGKHIAIETAASARRTPLRVGNGQGEVNAAAIALRFDPQWCSGFDPLFRKHDVSRRPRQHDEYILFRELVVALAYR